jgi:hypothetical protein
MLRGVPFLAAVTSSVDGRGLVQRSARDRLEADPTTG